MTAKHYNSISTNVEWENKWCINFNASKCNTIAIMRKIKKLNFEYHLHNQTLERTDSTTVPWC